MSEFVVSGRKYRTKKMSAMTQMHLSRKVAPLIPPLLPVFMQLSRDLALEEAKAKASEDGIDVLPQRSLGEIFLEAPDELSGMMQPLADALGGMKDDDAEKLFEICLTHTEYNSKDDGTTWVPIYSPAAKALMFEDIVDGFAMIQIAINVIKDQLGPFIAGFLTDPAVPVKTQ